jgi:reverse transcriptase-like protein
VSILGTLLARGYFPKELPPAFFTEQFARYATTKSGRSTLACYKPAHNFTECVKYQLARPGFDRRELRIPHPASFATLSSLVSANFSRLLKKAGRSKISRSRPVYSAGRFRAIAPTIKHSDLWRERVAIRAGSSFFLKTDVSQFYPSLYTHAVGWAVDPRLRNRANWGNPKFLGKKIDQALMDLDGKVSQGIPIGNDISFLLAEVVLAQVDKALRSHQARALRWFDDYELTTDTREQAEEFLKRLNRELGKFRLRLNPKKTEISQLPSPAQDQWQQTLRAARLTNAQSIVNFFDIAFRFRETFPDEPVMMYALGLLFKIQSPSQEVARMALSCISQALLCEPGAAQKAFALLTFWKINGAKLDAQLVRRTANKMIVAHQAIGFSSDVAWALAFCLDQQYVLDAEAGQALSVFDDDCIALQALHMDQKGLLPKGFNKKKISNALKHSDLDREHWLISYESVRHGFLTVCAPAVKNNPLFSDLLKSNVTFYRRSLPSYAAVIHAGGAPGWVVRQWLGTLKVDGRSVDPRSLEREATEDVLRPPAALMELIQRDFAKVGERVETAEEAAIELMEAAVENAESEDSDMY